ncbi:MAG: hypothetical protein RIR00_1509 [Pseudomonadota bacterium]
MPKLPRTALLALLAPLAAPAAASINDFTELSLEQLLDVEIVSASRFTQRASDAPSAVSVLTANDIRDYGWRTLAEALNSVRGFVTSSDRTYSYAGIRGFSPPGDFTTRLLVLIDGVRTNDNVFDQAYIGNEFLLDLDLVDRIEIVRGPSSLDYGGNAFFGVINVITRHGGDIKGTETAVSSGSRNSREARISHGQRFDNGADLLLSHTAYEARGQNLSFPEFPGQGSNNDGERYGKTFAKLNWNGLQLETAWSRRNKQVPTGANGVVFDDPGNRNVDTQGFFDARLTRQVADGVEVSGRLFYGQYDYAGDFRYDQTPLAGVVTNQDRAAGRWWGGETKLLLTGWQDHTLVIGAEYQQNRRQDQWNRDADPASACFANGLAAPACLDSRQKGYRLGVYVQDNYRLSPTLHLHAGVRYDHANLSKDRLSPRLGLIWHAQPHSVFKLLYGSAYRAPNAWERFYEFPGAQTQIGNSALKPETITSYEAVWEYYLTPTQRLSSSLYYYNVDDWIVQTEVGGPVKQLQYQNQARVSGKGFDLGLEQQLAGNARLRGSFSAQIVPDHPNGNHNASPRYLGKLNYASPIPGLSNAFAGIEGRYVAPQATSTGHISGYTVLNANLRWQPWGSKGPELALAVYNLFDRAYSGVFIDDSLASGNGRTSLLQDGRAFRLKLSYLF